jgi:hypothetical protein
MNLTIAIALGSAVIPFLWSLYSLHHYIITHYMGWSPQFPTTTLRHTIEKGKVSSKPKKIVIPILAKIWQRGWQV